MARSYQEMLKDYVKARSKNWNAQGFSLNIKNGDKAIKELANKEFDEFIKGQQQLAIDAFLTTQQTAELSDAERLTALQTTMAAQQIAETQIPAIYPKSRTWTIVCALWRIGWRPIAKNTNEPVIQSWW